MGLWQFHFGNVQKQQYSADFIFEQSLLSLKTNLQVFHSQLENVFAWLTAQTFFQTGKYGKSWSAQAVVMTPTNFFLTFYHHYLQAGVVRSESDLIQACILFFFFVKLHSNLHTQFNFSWLEQELTLFSHGRRRRKEGRTHTQLLAEGLTLHV